MIDTYTIVLRAGAIAFREQAGCSLNSGTEQHLCHTIADALDKWAAITLDDDAWNEICATREVSLKNHDLPESIARALGRRVDT